VTASILAGTAASAVAIQQLPRGCVVLVSTVGVADMMWSLSALLSE